MPAAAAQPPRPNREPESGASPITRPHREGAPGPTAYPPPGRRGEAEERQHRPPSCRLDRLPNPVPAHLPALCPGLRIHATREHPRSRGSLRLSRRHMATGPAQPQPRACRMANTRTHARPGKGRGQARSCGAADAGGLAIPGRRGDPLPHHGPERPGSRRTHGKNGSVGPNRTPHTQQGYRDYARAVCARASSWRAWDSRRSGGRRFVRVSRRAGSRRGQGAQARWTRRRRS